MLRALRLLPALTLVALAGVAAAVTAVCLGGCASRVEAAPWTTTTPLPSAYNGHSMVYARGRLYLTAGISQDGGIVEATKVYSAPVGPSGTVGAWTAEPALPEAAFYHAGAAANGFVYVLGGYHYNDVDGVFISDAVSYAKITADGSLGAWQSAAHLPEPVFFPGAAVWNGRIYVSGGWNGSELTNAVYSAIVNPDGSLGPWTAQKPLPEGVYTHAEVAYGTLYVLGGTVHGGADIVNTVYFAKINADGTLADWATTSPLPQPVANHAAIMANGWLFVMGGWTGGAVATDAVHSATVAADGTLGGWSAETPLPRPLFMHAAATDGSHVFVSGGSDPTDMRAGVYSMALPGGVYTPPGTGVQVAPTPGITLTFDHITSAGVTSVVLEHTGPPPPIGFQMMPVSPPVYSNLSTTAAIAESVTVCLAYDQSQVIGSEANLRMYHYDAGVPGWVNVTSSLDTGANVLCGRTTTLSPFVIVEPDPTTGVPEAGDIAFGLSAASPSPFRGMTAVEFGLPTAGIASVRVFDVTGRLVRVLARGPYEAGRHRLVWDGHDEQGRRAGSAVYFCRLEANGISRTTKMVLSR
jgi:hypothetical protein